MTADEPEISVIPPGESHAQQPSADEDRWLTYLNYDRAIQQAVRRLGALSSANVDEFRALLLKGRDRSRVSDYEAESIRRLQGEAFVGDEDLQRALIVLNAEDPRLGEELKRVVATTGKPQELDQTVAAIRARLDGPKAPAPIQPSRRAQKDQAPAEQIRENPAPPKAQEPPRLPQTPPLPVISAHAEPPPAEQGSWAKRLAIPGAIAAVVAIGLFLVWPRIAGDSAQKIANAQSVPLRPATPEDARATPPEAPSPPAPPAQTAAAPQAETPKPAPESAAVGESEKAPPEKAAASPDTPPAPMPVPSANYRVVRGDMLSQIALRAYHDASKFRLIQQANPSLRNKPDLILVDQTIYIPPAP